MVFKVDNRENQQRGNKQWPIISDSNRHAPECAPDTVSVIRILATSISVFTRDPIGWRRVCRKPRSGCSGQRATKVKGQVQTMPTIPLSAAVLAMIVQRNHCREGACLAFSRRGSRGGLAHARLENSLQMSTSSRDQPVTIRLDELHPLLQAEPTLWCWQPGPRRFRAYFSPGALIRLKPKPLFIRRVVQPLRAVLPTGSHTKK